MIVYRLNLNTLLDLLGIAQEEPDETVLSTVNVRLEEMFRETARSFPNIVRVHEEDLRKIYDAGMLWREQAHRLEFTLSFTREEGLTEAHMRNLNGVPANFAQRLGQNERLVFCHSPMLQYVRDHSKFTLTISMNIVYAPGCSLVDHTPQKEGVDAAVGLLSNKEAGR